MGTGHLPYSLPSTIYYLMKRPPVLELLAEMRTGRLIAAPVGGHVQILPPIRAYHSHRRIWPASRSLAFGRFVKGSDIMNTNIVSLVRRARMVLSIVLAVLAIGTAPITAHADTVYFYNSQGTPVDVTASVIYQNPYVFDAHSNIIGNVDANGVIRDPATNAVIGYVSVNP